MKEQEFGKDFTKEEKELFEEKFCHGIIKAEPLSEEEVEQLIKEGGI